MKFNWGTGIFAFYVIFASTLFYQIYRASQYDHSLVVENYYEKDLKYQSQMDKESNSLTLKDPVKIAYNKEQKAVKLAFPLEVGTIEGTVLFYRPSDKKLDLELPLKLNAQNEMAVNVSEFLNGFWKIEVEWEAGDKDFFDEDSMMIQNMP